MDIEYKREYNKSFMVIKVSKDKEPFEEKMISRNRIRTFLPQQILIKDEEKQYWYDITGRDSLRHRIEYGKIDVYDIKRLFQCMQNVMEELQEYLLDASHIILSMDAIFIDRSNTQFLFGYNPYQENSFEINLRGLFESILREMDHSDMEFVTVMYGIFELLQKETFSVEEILLLINGCNTDSYDEKDIVNKSEPEVIEEKLNTKERKEKKKKKLTIPRLIGLYIPEKKQKKEEAIFVCEEEKDWSEEEHTMLLSESNERKIARLHYDGKGGQEDITLDSDSILIGSSIENYGVIVSATVSKRHARITRCKDNYFVEDLNSTNGTYVNDEMLNYQEKRLLSSQDRVRFADEQYIFE